MLVDWKVWRTTQDNFSLEEGVGLLVHLTVSNETRQRDQSYRNLGSVVALLQGNLKKVMN